MAHQNPLFPICHWRKTILRILPKPSHNDLMAFSKASVRDGFNVDDIDASVPIA